MACPGCDSTNCTTENGELYKEELYPEVEFKNVITVCKDCGFGWNSVGTKKI